MNEKDFDMTKKTNRVENFMESLATMIDSLFTSTLSNSKENHMQTQHKAIHKDEPETTDQPIYESMEDYKAQTGKQFRRTKDQMDRNLTREEAFNETYGGSN